MQAALAVEDEARMALLKAPSSGRAQRKARRALEAAEADVRAAALEREAVLGVGPRAASAAALTADMQAAVAAVAARGV